MRKARELHSYQYICKKINNPLNTGGGFNENIWEGIELVALVRNNGEELTDSYSTKAQICRDDENLYIRFVCKDPHVWATMKGQNEPLWQEEVIEVFIDPDGDGKNYIELEVNPLNNTLTLLVPDAEATGDWKENAKFELKGLKTYVSRDTKGWMADIVIPLENFATWAGIPPREGDQWRLNLYRVERPVKEKPEDYILMAWSPTFENNFHVPQLFGEVVFR